MFFCVLCFVFFLFFLCFFFVRVGVTVEGYSSAPTLLEDSSVIVHGSHRLSGVKDPHAHALSIVCAAY